MLILLNSLYFEIQLSSTISRKNNACASFPFFLCICYVFAYSCRCMYTCRHMYVESKIWCWVSLPWAVSTLSSETGSLGEPGAQRFHEMSWAVSSRGASASWPQEWGYSYMSSHLAFYMGPGDPNSGPHIYLANTSPTEPSPSFQHFSKECISPSVIKTFVGPCCSDILLSAEYSSLHLITYKAFLQGINLLHKIFLIIIKQILTFNLASHISLK